jgi:tetratricopeptide (TPR) repeat protein/predicted Ser/Thr protein kinase
MLSHYRLVEKIGEGGMGVVWKAEDTVLNRIVAIKVLPADLALEAERRRMFHDEARLTASMNDAHIVQVHELGREGDLDFIVMEYVAGQSLSRILNGRPLPPSKVADLGHQVAQGLARAHRKALLHRDLKPANILITPDGEAKIVDFGLATLFSRSDSTATSTTMQTETTRRPSIAGTIPYMSPEQIRGEKLDARSDIFSLGTVLYEMTTGQRPFGGPGAAEVAQEILRGKPRAVHELVPKVPLDLDRIIEKSLAPRPEDRYQHIDDLAVDLKRLGKWLETDSAPSYEKIGTLVPRRRRSRLPFWVAAAAVVLFATGWFVFERRAPGHGRTSVAASVTPAGTPNWILVAEFEGPPGMPDLARGVRELVIAVLEQSTVVTPIPRSDLERGLQLAMKPDTTRVIGSVARELAFRAAARTYVEGRIDKILTGYSIVLRVLDSEDDRLVASASSVAASDEVVISTVDRLGRELRVKLGEREEAVRATRGFQEIVTPSFEAYKKYLQASSAFFQRNQHDAGKRLMRQALTLDPDLGRAWSLLWNMYFNLGDLDSARVVYQEMSRRYTRQTETQRLLGEADARWALLCDAEGALRCLDEMAALDPKLRWHWDRGAVLVTLGKPEEAIEAWSRASDLSPFGIPAPQLGNWYTTLLRLGRYDEAAGVVGKLPEGWKPGAELDLAVSAGNWSLAESLAIRNARSSALSGPNRRSAVATLAALEARNGRLRTALDGFERLADGSSTRGDARFARFTERFLRCITNTVPVDGVPPVLSDSTAQGLVDGALQAAVYADTMAVRSFLDRLARKSECDRKEHKSDVALLEAWIAASAHRWSKVIQLVGSETGLGSPWGSLPIRWLVGRAQESQGDLEAAAKSYTQLLVLKGCDDSDRLILRPLLLPFAHRWLALLYSRMGRIDEAQKHWRAFKETLSQPDPELLPMIEQTRKVLAAAGVSA